MKTWTGVELTCPEALADELAAQAAQLFQVAVEVNGDRVLFYPPRERSPEDVERALDTLLKGFARALSLPSRLLYRVFSLEDEGWAHRWKEHFKPLHASRSLVVRPTWESYEAGPGERVIVMDPGQAFGTGHHETTRLCLQWLEDQRIRREGGGGSVLDVGTGTAILAMGAALLGWQSVRAVDTDPEAVKAAGENIALNGLRERVRLSQGSAADVSGVFDIVLANIEALPLIRMAPPLAERVAPGGRLALSGILEEQTESVENAYLMQGLRREDAREEGEWRLLAFNRERKEKP